MMLSVIRGHGHDVVSYQGTWPCCQLSGDVVMMLSVIKECGHDVVSYQGTWP